METSEYKLMGKHAQNDETQTMVERIQNHEFLANIKGFN